LLENPIDMEKIYANSVEDCTNESVMEFLESSHECDASVTAEFVKAEVLAKVTFAMSEKDPALRVMKAVADYYSLHRNLRLDFINGKPKKAAEHLVSVIRPATLKARIESRLEMDKSELKKDFLEFVKYLEEMAIIHDEHCHVVEQNVIQQRTWLFVAGRAFEQSIPYSVTENNNSSHKAINHIALLRDNYRWASPATLRAHDTFTPIQKRVSVAKSRRTSRNLSTQGRIESLACTHDLVKMSLFVSSVHEFLNFMSRCRQHRRTQCK
jgi:hypothetical protein